MRFTPGLLLALASSISAQRFTNSSVPATESATTTGTALPTESAGAPEPIDLGNAQLGAGCGFVDGPDGSKAIRMSAGPNGVASFTVGGANPEGIDVGDLISVLFQLLAELLQDARKRADSDCTLEVTLNGQSVFSEGLQNSGGYVDRSSSGAPATADAPELSFVQTCGSNPIAATIAGVKVAAGSGSGGNGGGNPIVTDTTLTNSEGEPTATVTDTIVPTDTETETNTNSEGATTNSEGETVTATGTETATNSEGATTNSEGETVTATGTETAPTSTGTSAAGFPGSIGDFALFGCVGSSKGFPTFELAESSGSMDLDRCASLCEGRSYFGVHDEDCYCGDEINDDNTKRVNLDSCDIECPGDDSEFCGGDAPVSSRLNRRQSAIPNTILLTVYISVGGADVTLTDALTATVTDQSTITTTFTTTIEDATTTQTQTVTAIYECYNGQCYPETGNGVHIVYIFKPYPGEECDGQYVYISEACSCKGGSQYVPKYCSNGDCHGLTVYKPEQCDDWYNHDVCYTPANCDTCEHGQVVYKPWENNYGTPDHPNTPEVPVCSSSGCPSSEHPKPAPPCYGNNCEGSGSKPAPPCTGDNCGSKPAPPCTGDNCEGSGSKPAPPCTGDNCGESGSKPAPPCTGDNCEETGSKGSSGGSSNSGSNSCTGSGCEETGSKGSSGGSSSGEAPCSGDNCSPTIVSSAGKQAVGGLAALAAIAAALL
ncbi:hypothetical protein FLAG1_01136 [Fusarium langsethiae]|uniref:WSC domain-containing protein n=1 Tax=Fusarium langsethiae TaxID=179993 RepID=A0A0N0DHU4_FUSLA|nr:hypothetical protein FLAG1_01136 [Fusarium langsethiae]